MARLLRLGPQGRLVLPAAMRRELGLAPGDELAVKVEDRRIVIEPRNAALREIQQELRQARGDRSLVDELIAQRRREAAAEAAG